jgi:hypothetical protein
MWFGVAISPPQQNYTLMIPQSDFKIHLFWSGRLAPKLQLFITSSDL